MATSDLYRACCCEPMDCGDLPAEVDVSWSGGAAVTFTECDGCDSAYNFIGTLTAPAAVTFTATQFGTPPDCVYCCDDTNCGGCNGYETASDSLDVEECDGTPVGTIVWDLTTTVGPPIARTTAPYAGRWTVSVEVSASCTSGCAYLPDWAGTSMGTCGIGFGASGAILFVGPLISASPVGTYTPGASEVSTWFDCTFASCASASVDSLGTVTVT